MPIGITRTDSSYAYQSLSSESEVPLLAKSSSIKVSDSFDSAGSISEQHDSIIDYEVDRIAELNTLAKELVGKNRKLAKEILTIQNQPRNRPMRDVALQTAGVGLVASGMGVLSAAIFPGVALMACGGIVYYRSEGATKIKAKPQSMSKHLFSKLDMMSAKDSRQVIRRLKDLGYLSRGKSRKVIIEPNEAMIDKLMRNVKVAGWGIDQAMAKKILLSLVLVRHNQLKPAKKKRALF